MSEASDTRPTVAAKAGDWVELRSGAIVGPLKDAGSSLCYPLGNGDTSWTRGGRVSIHSQNDPSDIVAIVPRPAEKTTDHPIVALVAEHGDFVELRDGTQLGPVRIDAKNAKWPISAGGDEHKLAWRPSGRFVGDDVETSLDIVKVVPRPSLTAQPPDDEPTACGRHPSGYAIELIIEHHSRNVAGALVNLLHVHVDNWDDETQIEEAARLLNRELKRIAAARKAGG